MSDRDGAEKPRHSKRLRAMVATSLAAPIPIASTGDVKAGFRPQGGKPAGCTPAKLLAAVSLLGVSLGVSAAPTLDGAGSANIKNAAARDRLAQSKPVESHQLKFIKQRPVESHQHKIIKQRKARKVRRKP